MTQQVTTHDLWVDGREMQITAVKPTTTTLQLTWTLPNNPKAYAGYVVLVSDTPLAAQDFPVDGTRYTASSNLAAPSSKIGRAQVVAAAYGFFGDPIEGLTVTVTNLDENKLYYASIHACSNILQYYTVGSQSYPLETDNYSPKKNSAYSDAIPQSTVAPENPTDGQVYFDPSTNAVLMWVDAQQAWVKANSNPIAVAPAAKIDVGSIFFVTTSNELNFFNGTQWVVADASNVRVKMGGSWATFNGIQSVSAYPESPTSGDWIYITYRAEISAPQTYYLKTYSLGQWFNPTPGMVEVLIGATWTPIKETSYDSAWGSSLPPIPAIGDFFYNSSTRDLMVWNGSWVKADTADPGTPLPDKTGVGTDGTRDARMKLIQTVKTEMGYPAVCVELKEENFELAVENALQQFRSRSDSAYETRYISMTLTGTPSGGGQNKYYFNDPRNGTDRVVNVLKIHRVNQLGISSLSAETGLYAQAFFNQLYQGSNVDILSIHLMNQLAESYEKIFAGNINFLWNEARRELTILRRIINEAERVVVECIVERTEQELIEDRYASLWLQDWAYAEALEMLGLIRSKYSTLPSATGGLTLNGDTLLTMAEAKKTELQRQINDYEVGNGGVNHGNCSVLIG